MGNNFIAHLTHKRRTMNKNYEKYHSHSHCFESENPPCGMKGLHRCCLCQEPVPDDIKKETTRLRTLIANTIGDMLDNPDENGIYPTTVCFNRLVNIFHSELLSQLQELEELVKRIKVGKPSKESEELPYGIKKIVMKETVDVVLSLISSLREKI